MFKMLMFQPMGEQFSQTENQVHVTKESQTAKIGDATKRTQTEKVASTEKTTQAFPQLFGKTTQTKVHSYGERAMQTEEKELTEQFMQTEVKQLCARLTQTEIKILKNKSFQTEPLPVGEFCMQTDQWIGTHQCHQICPDLAESAFQTDPPPMRVSVVQTEIDTDEKFMQTENPISEKFTQTKVAVKEQKLQTDPTPVTNTPSQTDIAALKNIEVQTTRDYYAEVVTQTDDVFVIHPENLCEKDCQTDFVRVIDPLDERSHGSQTAPCKVIYPDQYTGLECQTDAVKIIDPELMTAIEVQTEDVHIRDTECQAEVDIQTDDVAFKDTAELVDTEAQTNLVWIFGLTQAPEPEEEEQVEKAPAVPPVIPEGGDIPPDDAVPTGPAVGKVDQQSHIIQGGPVEPQNMEIPQGTEISEDGDTQKGIQTDPVTIIIGDSSFLVNKLKVYAQREMRFMEGGKRRGRGRGGVRPGQLRSNEDGPPPLMAQGDMPSREGDDKDMPVLNAERTPGGAGAVKKMPMSAPPAATRRPFTGLRHRTSPQDISDICKTPEKKGRFNCPFCPSVFNDSAALYKHLHATHGSPRASNRRRRRKGTILIAEDGTLITDDGTIEIPPLKKDVDMGPIRANNTQKSQAAILHEQHVAKMQAIANTNKINSEKRFGKAAQQEREVVANGTTTAQDVIQVSETPLMGKRAFSCPICPKLFTKSSALYIHLQNTHKAERHKSKPASARPSSVKAEQEGAPEEEVEEGEIVGYVDPAADADDADADVADGDGEGETLVEEYVGGEELVHEEEVELVVQAEEGEVHDPELIKEEGAKPEEGEVVQELQEPEEGEVPVPQEEEPEEGEVEVPPEEGEVTLEEGEVPVEQEPEEEPEEGEVQLEPGETVEEEVIEKESPEPPRPRGKVRTRGGHVPRPPHERSLKRRRSEVEDDDEEMPKLTPRTTRSSVMVTLPTRSGRRGPKILSPASKRGRRK